ncbi:MAG: PP2C family protein-serine/threonine phosphatase, partial [Terracidiphilus sp.]
LLNLVFFHSLLHERRRVLFWIGTLPMLLPVPALCFSLAGWTSVGFYREVSTLCFLPYIVAVALLLMHSSLKRNSEAWLLLVPFTLSSVYWLYSNALSLVDLARHPALAALNNRLGRLITWPFIMGLGEILGLMCISSVCGVLILRFARSRRDEERLASELEAARVVQQILVPTENPSVPGLEIQAIYRPAGQVGGDFYQIVPTPVGGVLVVIGDVSGKGMPAAMTVSLLVGTFRTLAHYTQSPGEILVAMNQRMLARSHGGFTTCLVLRIDTDGAITAANAGHLSPYSCGAELAIDNGLPLGLAEEAQYLETTFTLPARAQLTLMTDGVVEAQSKTGELFGFDRAAAISTKPAEEIARAAQDFGQEDDITVLTLLHQPA